MRVSYILYFNSLMEYVVASINRCCWFGGGREIAGQKTTKRMAHFVIDDENDDAF